MNLNITPEPVPLSPHDYAWLWGALHSKVCRDFSGSAFREMEYYVQRNTDARDKFDENSSLQLAVLYQENAHMLEDSARFFVERCNDFAPFSEEKAKDFEELLHSIAENGANVTIMGQDHVPLSTRFDDEYFDETMMIGVGHIKHLRKYLHFAA